MREGGEYGKIVHILHPIFPICDIVVTFEIFEPRVFFTPKPASTVIGRGSDKYLAILRYRVWY